MLSFDPNSVIAMVSLAFAWMFLLMFSLWGVSIIIKNAGVVDIGWAFGIMGLAVIYFMYSDGYMPRQLFILGMMGIWGLRLSFILLWRLLTEKNEDPRYQRIRQGWEAKAHLTFFLYYQLQGFSAIILSVPALIICINSRSSISPVEWIGFILWLVAIIGETLADDQLRGFKNNPANKGKTCRVGLWNYSRHPNYFFDWLVWCSFFVFALGSPMGWVTIVCPALMLYFLLQVTGVPLAEEEALRTRGEDYREYQRTTSVFIPWFKPKAT